MRLVFLDTGGFDESGTEPFVSRQPRPFVAQALLPLPVRCHLCTAWADESGMSVDGMQEDGSTPPDSGDGLQERHAQDKHEVQFTVWGAPHLLFAQTGFIRHQEVAKMASLYLQGFAFVPPPPLYQTPGGLPLSRG